MLVDFLYVLGTSCAMGWASTLVNLRRVAKLGGVNDTFMLKPGKTTVRPRLSSMTDAQRLASEHAHGGPALCGRERYGSKVTF